MNTEVVAPDGIRNVKRIPASMVPFGDAWLVSMLDTIDVPGGRVMISSIDTGSTYLFSMSGRRLIASSCATVAGQAKLSSALNTSQALTA